MSVVESCLDSARDCGGYWDNLGTVVELGNDITSWDSFASTRNESVGTAVCGDSVETAVCNPSTTLRLSTHDISHDDYDISWLSGGSKVSAPKPGPLCYGTVLAEGSMEIENNVGWGYPPLAKRSYEYGDDKQDLYMHISSPEHSLSHSGEEYSPDLDSSSPPIDDLSDSSPRELGSRFPNQKMVGSDPRRVAQTAVCPSSSCSGADSAGADSVELYPLHLCVVAIGSGQISLESQDKLNGTLDQVVACAVVPALISRIFVALHIFLSHSQQRIGSGCCPPSLPAVHQTCA